MLIRFSARPSGSPEGRMTLAARPSAVIERFFALLERLAPLPEVLETKASVKRASVKPARKKPSPKSASIGGEPSKEPS
jgi:hypothetical protein